MPKPPPLGPTPTYQSYPRSYGRCRACKFRMTPDEHQTSFICKSDVAWRIQLAAAHVAQCAAYFWNTVEGIMFEPRLAIDKSELQRRTAIHALSCKLHARTNNPAQASRARLQLRRMLTVAPKTQYRAASCTRKIDQCCAQRSLSL